MPVITTTVSIPLDEAKKSAMTAAYKKSCHTRLGKGEEWVMTIFNEGADMYYRGSKEPVAFVNVQIYGPVMPFAASPMTEDITEAVTKATGIAAQRIYVCYYGAECFGWNGHNFA